MTSYRSRTLLITAAAVLLWAPSGLANPMDITLSRLVTDPLCGQPGTPPNPDCEDVTDLEAFRDLSRELGFAMSPFVLAPAETLGYAAFYTGLEGQITFISKSKHYWVNGTEEKRPAGALFLSAIHVRKGLPGGLELGTTLGYMAQTEQVVLGMDIKLAPFQGWRKGVGGAFPDMAIRGTVNQLLGEDELNLTTIGIDASVSWPITILDQSTLTPYAAYQFMWIIADAEVVDATPNRSFVQECGTPLGDCTGGDPTDSHNNLDFERQYIHTHRLVVGLRFIYEYLAFSAQYAIGLPANKHEQNKNVDPMHQITFGIGADY